MENQQPVILPGLSPREAALDAYYRITWAFDTNDWQLFESGWVTNSEPEFHIEEFGVKCLGMKEIKEWLWEKIINLDTQHIATNSRVYIEPGATTGKIWVMGLNQHFRKDQGAKAGAPRLWGGNQYHLDVVEENGAWRVKKWSAKMGWNEGDLTIVGR